MACLLWYLVQFNAVICNPLLIGLGAGEAVLQFLVGNHSALVKIDQKNTSGLQSALFNYPRWIYFNHADFGGHDAFVIVGDVIT